MPGPSEIVRSLTEIANTGIPLAMAWHLAAIAAIVGLGSGWRPHLRTAGLLMAAPVASVAVVGWLAGSPFNAAVFSALAAVLGLIALRLPAGRIAPPPGWALIAGALAVLFGLAYPHFLDGEPLTLYLVASPVGLVPCPTLAVVIGFTLLTGGLHGRMWGPVLLAAGTFYSLFGVLRLGVLLDLGLLAATAALAFLIARPHARPLRAATAHHGGPR